MLNRRERKLFRLTKSELVDIIIQYESKLQDMELDDMIVTTSKTKQIQVINDADAALLRYNKKLRKGKYGSNKIIKSKRKKTAKLCKR